MPRITPSLWFDTQALDAAQFYVSVFPNSSITATSHYGEGGPREAGLVLTVEFLLDAQPYLAINGGPQFPFTEAVSLVINCADQPEVDYYWDKLGDGGSYSQCGWLKDRFGLSWQVVPVQLPEVLSDPDPQRARRAMEAMLALSKIDLVAIKAAADGRS